MTGVRQITKQLNKKIGKEITKQHNKKFGKESPLTTA